MIEDKQLRSLYGSESEEHLRKLEQEFLQLKKKPNDTALLDAMRREAHGLKGAARMIGLTRIDNLSHILEDTFTAAGRGDVILDSKRIKDLYRGLEAVKALVAEAVLGTPVEVDVDAVSAMLKRGAGEAAEEIENAGNR
ncbi:MAG: Hpt domain-containing protein [Candidatus Electrothrix communis]|nr:MAG: Hpt domain-containing protein [Candidatus Electrothrix communis]